MLQVDQKPTKIDLRPGYKVLGVDISPYSQHEFYSLIATRLTDSHPESPPLFVVTVNPEMVILSILDNEFREIIMHSSINTADGVGISWAINYLYNQKVERITGSDSVERICNIASHTDQSVFFYGAMPNVADNAAQQLQDKIPNLNVETYSPSRSDLPIDELPLDTQYYLKEASVIFVALGAPAQEKWIHNNIAKLPRCKLIIGIGGSFDFLAGTIKRAPSWMCKMGIEWLYRLYKQPTRWRRMVKLPMFALNILLLKMSDQYKQLQKQTPVIHSEIQLPEITQ